MKQAWKFLRRLLLALVALGLLGILGPRLITSFFSWSRIYNAANAPFAPAAVVFGAGLTRTGEPTAILKDRVETAAKLYFEGKVQKLLMSGDNRTLDHNEPEAMRQYAIRLGVPSSAIVLDYAGRRTYDTCYRAKAIFGLDSALLVTQGSTAPGLLRDRGRLIREGTLPATQVVETTPWIIARESLLLGEVQSAIEAVRTGRQLSRADSQQTKFPF